MKIVPDVVRAPTRSSAPKVGQLEGRGRHLPGKHAPRVPFALLVTVLIAGGMGLLLLLNTASAANEVQRHDLSARDASIAARVQELQNEVAASAAPGNLAAAAAALGMVPAANPAFLVVGTDGSIKVMGSAAPASEVHVAQQRPKKKAKPTKTAASTTAAKSTAKSSAKSTAHGAAGHTAARTTSAATSAPHPAPTPTPTVTLPGGNR